MNQRLVPCFTGALLLFAACNPVNSDAIAALGGENPNVRRGPLHRPGQPCLLCHDGQLGNPPAFSIAGTVFEFPGAVVGADLASVVLTDADGGVQQTLTNAAGNFYLTPSDWSPTFPLTKVTVTGANGVTATMQSEVGRDGACASCHVDPPSSFSPGHVAVSAEDGGALP